MACHTRRHDRPSPAATPAADGRRTIKHGEYADAGIPHYWIVDIDPRPTLTASHRAGEFGYVDAPAVTGVFTAEEPFPVRLELDQLLRPPGQR